MELKSQLQELKDSSSSRIPAQSLQIMSEEAKDLESRFNYADALDVGQKFPQINGNSLSQELFQELENGALVIVFYRGGWCPYCNLELQAYEKVYEQIKSLGANLVAISPEKVCKSNELSDKHALSFKLLNDPNNELAKELGIAFKVSDELSNAYLGFGIDIDDSQGNSEKILPIPATYIVNKNGEIVYRFLETDYTKRCEPSEVIELLKAHVCKKCAK